MKFTRLLTIILFSTLPFYSVAEEAYISIGYESGWPPYVSIDQVDGGIAPKVMQEVFGSDKISFLWAPWARVIRLAKKGEVDCIAAAYYRKEREQYFLYSDKFLHDDSVIITRNDINVTGHTIDALKGVRTGIVRAYGYPKEIKENKKVNYLNAHSSNELLSMLAAKRVDAIIISELTAIYLLNTKYKHIKTKFRMKKKPIFSVSVHLICNKEKLRAKEFIEVFNKKIREMKSSGLLNKIIKANTLEQDRTNSI